MVAVAPLPFSARGRWPGHSCLATDAVSAACSRSEGAGRLTSADDEHGQPLIGSRWLGGGGHGAEKVSRATATETEDDGRQKPSTAVPGGLPAKRRREGRSGQKPSGGDGRRGVPDGSSDGAGDGSGAAWLAWLAWHHPILPRPLLSPVPWAVSDPRIRPCSVRARTRTRTQ